MTAGGHRTDTRDRCQDNVQSQMCHSSAICSFNVQNIQPTTEEYDILVSGSLVGMPCHHIIPSITTALANSTSDNCSCLQQALQQQMADQGVAGDAVSHMFGVEAAMEAWHKAGRPNDLLSQADALLHESPVMELKPILKSKDHRYASSPVDVVS